VAADVFASRTRVIRWTLTGVLGLFVGRLYLLQVVNGERYREGSLANSEKVTRLEAPRGLIFDRKGRLLVGNRHSFDLVLDRQPSTDLEAVAAFVAQVTGEAEASLLERMSAKDLPAHRPIVLARDLAFSQVAWIEARREDVPGLSIETNILRQYPNGNLAAHVLGYVGEIDAAELDRAEFDHHKARDQVGKGGVERGLDDLLSGQPGQRITIVNNVGREMASKVKDEPRPGDNVTLTLDLDVQEACETGLAGRRGACVMLDVRTGGVIALASSPPYDPNAFVGGISSVRWNEYRNDPHEPLSFRAIAGTYPPGSVWKALVSAAAIQSGKHQASTSVTCRGVIDMYNRPRHCWKEEGHGTVDMKQAFIHSCNVYYYTAGRDMGAQPMWDLGEAVGFGQLTGIDVAGEKGGIMPTDAWKKKTGKTNDDRRWWPGDTINMSIGQGYLAVTPLQVAVFGMSIANGGDVHRPHLLDHANDATDGHVAREGAIETVRHVPYKGATLTFLHDAMEGVVAEGTGTLAQVKGIKVAGKTGTAQPSSGEAPKGIPREQRPERYQEHAWFMGYAPADAPEVAFAVVLEHVGLHGGTAAAPVAREMLEALYADRLSVSGQ